jgi:carboxyl-terminal processing protease
MISKCHSIRGRRFLKPLALLLAVVLLPASLAGQGTAPSVHERLQLLEQVWRAIDERYYDRNFHGVDWGEKLRSMRPLVEQADDLPSVYRVLRRMVASLADAHTRIYSPEDAFDRNRPAGITTGVSVRSIEGVPIITWVEPGSEGAKQGLKPGMRVQKIDGRPIAVALAAAREDVGPSSTPLAREVLSFERIFYGPRDTTLELEVERPDSEVVHALLRRRFAEFQRRVISRKLPNDIGYIEVTGFAPEIEREFDAAIAANQESKGLIIDLRNNGGGFVTTVTRLASHFFARETDLGVFTTRQGRAMPRRTDRVRNIYRGPVVVLVSARTASGAEMFAAAMQERKRARILGTSSSTCGCLVGVSRSVNLPDGGRLNVSDTDFRTARGTRVEGVGVIPDERIELTIADLRDGRDLALERSVSFLSHLELPPDADLSIERSNR